MQRVAFPQAAEVVPSAFQKLRCASASPVSISASWSNPIPICLARLDQRKLVEPDPGLPVPDRANKLRCHANFPRPRIKHNKVVAQPVHLHERQCLSKVISHDGHITTACRRIQHSRHFHRNRG